MAIELIWRVGASHHTNNFALSILLVLAFVCPFGIAVFVNYRRLKGRLNNPPTQPVEDFAYIKIAAAQGERFDRICLNTTRSIEAAAAVTAAISILSIQLVHEQESGFTTVGFWLAVSAFGVSLFGTILVISTPLRIQDRAKVREDAQAEGAETSTAMDAVLEARSQAWTGIALRFATLGIITALLVGAMIFMALGQFRTLFGR